MSAVSIFRKDVEREVTQNRFKLINRKLSPFPLGATYNTMRYIKLFTSLFTSFCMLFLSAFLIVIVGLSIHELLLAILLVITATFWIHTLSVTAIMAYKKRTRWGIAKAAAYIFFSQLALSLLLTLTIALTMVYTKNVLLFGYEYLWAAILIVLVLVYSAVYVETDFNSRNFKLEAEKLKQHIAKRHPSNLNIIHEHHKWERNWNL